MGIPPERETIGDCLDRSYVSYLVSSTVAGLLAGQHKLVRADAHNHENAKHREHTLRNTDMDLPYSNISG